MRKRLFAIFMTILMLVGSLSFQIVAADEPKAPVTWDPETVRLPTVVVLSNSKLRITFNVSGVEYVGATEYKTEGKWYWENTVSGGINNEPYILSGIFEQIYDYNFLNYSFNSRNSDKNLTCRPGDVVGVALDIDEYMIYYYVNGQLRDSKALSTRQEKFYAGVGGARVTSITSTVDTNFGATPFKYDVPEGYRPYDESGAWFYMPKLEVTDVGLYSVALQWNGIIDADYYEVEYDDGVLNSTDTNILIQGLQPKTLYTFRVRAVVDGEPGIWSNEVEVRTLGYGDDLEIVSISYISSTADTVLLKWPNKPDAEYYEIMCDNTLHTANTNEMLIAGLAPDTEYTFKVKACNTVYDGNWSAELTTRTKGDSGGTPDPQPAVNLALGAMAYSDSVTNRYEADLAIDGDHDTRWLSEVGATSCYLEIDFGRNVTFNRVIIEEFADRIGEYELMAWNGSIWSLVDSGYKIGNGFEANFANVTASKIRLDILTTIGTRPSIYEIEVYCD